MHLLCGALILIWVVLRFVILHLPEVTRLFFICLFLAANHKQRVRTVKVMIYHT